jgi:integrase
VLTWPDVRWDEWVLHIDSPKTGFRVCPIQPELRAVLEEAWDAAKEGDTHVVQGITKSKNLGTTLHKIIKRAGLVPWPKTFVNLRASCETEWMRAHPIHVACSWIGNSAQVALEHYARVTAEDQDRVARAVVNTGPKSEAQPEEVEAKSGSIAFPRDLPERGAT